MILIIKIKQRLDDYIANTYINVDSDLVATKYSSQVSKQTISLPIGCLPLLLLCVFPSVLLYGVFVWQRWPAVGGDIAQVIPCE